jgi:hypothetical protein
MGDRTFSVNIRLDRATWFQWKNLCHAHKVPVERATEVLLQEKLRENGIEVRTHQSPPVNVEGPMMVKS